MAERRQVAVIGLGRFGTAVATTLYEIGHDVLAMDTDRRLIQDLTGRVTHAIQADATDPGVLEEAGVASFATGIVGISSQIEQSILVTLNLKQLGVAHVIAKAQTAQHGEILARIGADRVVYPEREMGVRLAHSFAAPAVVDYMPLGPEYGIGKIRPPAAFVGRTLADLGLRERYGVTLLAVERGLRVIFNPRTDDTVQPGDFLVVAGADAAMARVTPA
jgi:trk system potassium uptake protein TrkA